MAGDGTFSRAPQSTDGSPFVVRAGPADPGRTRTAEETAVHPDPRDRSNRRALTAARMLRLQRVAGNRAVAAALQRVPDGGTTGIVHPGRFVNAGRSQLGNQLGFRSAGQYIVNGIEIVFDLDPGVRAGYRTLQPRQWTGPEAVYFKTGLPLGTPWHTMRRSGGDAPDDPEAESQRLTDQALVYDDSPGPSVLGHLGHSWIHTVQNFTGWVEGVPLSGGGPQRLTEVVAWNSVISVINPEASADGTGGGSYQPTAYTRSGTGWVPLDPPPL